MLDFRHHTFLTLCASQSFTKTAELLNMTQPAVSQHIRYLEEVYGCLLVDTANRKIRITEEGERLKAYATTVFSDYRHFRDQLGSGDAGKWNFRFGATMSIGEYVMPPILARLLLQHPEAKIQMTVANTHDLLEKLRQGELDFLLVEGLFDKSAYDSLLFRREPFLPVCAGPSLWANQQVDFPQITGSRLILREPGSGSREILENLLQKNNYSLQAFDKIVEIGSIGAMKQLVAQGAGITFLFAVTAKEEIENKTLAPMAIPGFCEEREFNFVFLKNTYFRDSLLSVAQEFIAMDEEREGPKKCSTEPGP